MRTSTGRDLGVGVPDRIRSTWTRPTSSAAASAQRGVLAGAGGQPCQRHAGLRPGEQVLREPRRDDDHPAAGAHPGPADRSQRWRPRVRDHAHPCSAGRAGLGVPHRDRLGLRRRGRRDGRAAGRAGRRAVGRGRPLRPGDPPEQPVPHHPRVDRPRDRAGPRAGLRGRVRRHLVRHLRPAGHAAVRQPGDERDRRPGGRPRPGHDRLRRRGRRPAAIRHDPRRHAGRLPAEPADGRARRAWAGPTGAPSPTPPATSRCSGCRTSRCSPRRTARAPRS